MNFSFLTIFLGISLAYNPDELLAGFLKGKKNCIFSLTEVISIHCYFDFIFYGIANMYVYVKSQLTII